MSNRWAACGQSIRLPSGSPAAHMAQKAAGDSHHAMPALRWPAELTEWPHGLVERTMSDKFESLGANEKAALESTLYRCRALVGRIGEELRKKKPEHFVDESSLADLHASLEHAAWVLEQKTAKG